jgi:hypothetical protein
MATEVALTILKCGTNFPLKEYGNKPKPYL